MAQVGKRDRSIPTKRPRSRALKRIVVLNARGETAAMKAVLHKTEVSVSEARFKRLSRNPRLLRQVLAGYADTVAKAEREGRSVTLTFKISPTGDAESTVVPENDPLDVAMAAAKERGRTKVAEILNGEDMLNARDFGPLIGASHETVHAKRRRFEILGLEGATRGVKYPRWQVTDSGLPLPGLSRLFDVLGDQPWTVYRFLGTAHPELGGCTALEALKEGRIDVVLGAAKNQVTGAFA